MTDEQAKLSYANSGQYFDLKTGLPLGDYRMVMIKDPATPTPDSPTFTDYNSTQSKKYAVHP